MSALAIRRAGRDDLARLVEIENAAFDHDRLSRRSFRETLASPASLILVAEAQGAVVGYGLVNFRKGSQVARLFSIAAVAGAPRGCGRALLQAIEREVIARGRVALRLEVRKTNARAIDIYERAGYRPIGTYEDYYEDGETALRLEKSFAAQVTTGSSAATS